MPVKLRKIVLKSGAAIEVTDGLTVLTGPNNVGKSLVLRELNQELRLAYGQSPNPVHRAVETVDLDIPDNADEIWTWLETNYGITSPGRYQDIHTAEPFCKPPSGLPITRRLLEQLCTQPKGRLGVLAPAVTLYLDAQTRLNLATSSQNFDILNELPSSPAQFLYISRELEKSTSDLMKRAFGVPLTVNRYAGSTIHLQVGRVELEETPPPPTSEYRAALEALPHLQEQGDGLRAFMGIVLAIMSGRYPIVLVDEPEAFLHPPQAYLLGQILAEQHDRGTQVIVATHSTDVLRGVTSSKNTPNRVSVVRMTRTANTNHVAQVPTGDVRTLYEDPLVRYYNILDGLFYHGVVLCEADSDCTYYRAVLSTIESVGDGFPTDSINLHFAQAGGKSRLFKAVRAFRAARVPVACIVDFDILQYKEEFTRLIRAYDGDLDAMQPLRNDVANAVSGLGTRVKRVAARALITEALDHSRDTYLTTGEATRISEAISAKTGWKLAKKSGKSCLSGQAATSFEQLNKMLRGLGIFIVEVGELERFHPDDTSQNKSAWLARVLGSRRYQQSAEAAALVSSIAARLLAEQ